MICSTVKLLGYNIFSDRKEFFTSDFKGVISTINPHSYIVARRDSIFRHALMTSDFLIPDGIGFVFASRVLIGSKIRKISGSDLHLILLKSLNQRKGRCFYLGSSKITLYKIRKKIRKEFPKITAGFYSPPYKRLFSDADTYSMIDAINNFVPDVLFVGMTAPKQEKWIFQNRQKLDVPIICAIGAVFDFYSGTVKRPVEFWVKIGLEWFIRLMKEPKRLWSRTLISTPLFIWCVLYEKINLIFNPIRNYK